MQGFQLAWARLFGAGEIFLARVEESGWLAKPIVATRSMVRPDDAIPELVAWRVESVRAALSERARG